MSDQDLKDYRDNQKTPAPTPPTPDTATDWPALTQQLGHPTGWPEHWHRILTTLGQADLLRTAAADWTTPRAA